MAATMNDVMSKVDFDILGAADVFALQDAGGDLAAQILAYAISKGKIQAVLTLVHECSVRVAGGGPNVVRSVPNDELLAMATRGDWGTVVYFLAAEPELLQSRLKATDTPAQVQLQQIAGAVRVQLPSDLRALYSRDGHLPCDLLVENPRWLLPRPSKQRSFSAPRNAKIEEGWYSVVQYPISDDLQDIVLRRKIWSDERRQAASRIFRSSGETLLCKAVKSEQWALVGWLLQQANNAENLAEQLDFEFVNLWDGFERAAVLRENDELRELLACLDAAGVLRREWRRCAKAVPVPVGSKLVWPRLEILQEAQALGWPSHELQLKGEVSSTAWRSPEGRQWRSSIRGAGILKFSVNQSREAKESWKKDAASLGESSFALPLLHRVVHAGQLSVMRKLLELTINVDACDSNGLSALVAAVSVRNWDAAELLLDLGGCRADGRSGALAKAVAQRASKEGTDDSGRAIILLEKIHKSLERCPTSSLSEFFMRQARGELMHGIEPRRFSLQDDALHRRSGGLQVWMFALVVGTITDSHRVMFVPLDMDMYANVASCRMLDLSRRMLYSEDFLIEYQIQIAVAVVLPAACLRQADRPGLYQAQAEGGGPLASVLPTLAIAPPTGTLHIQTSALCCCDVGVDRVEVFVEGVRLGESVQPLGDPRQPAELRVSVPPRQLNVSVQMCGMCVKQECIEASSDMDAFMKVELDIHIFIYTLVIDDVGTEFVYVAGHRRDVPEEDGARGFVGKVSWDGGSTQVSGLKPIPLGILGPDGNRPCLAKLSSLVLTPQLAPGRCWEKEDWVDSGMGDVTACQFQRLFGVPVKVGKIFTA